METKTGQPVTPALKEQGDYVYDIRGVKCRVNPEDETACSICEPWCTTCGYPAHICDPETTHCTGLKMGRWFNEHQDRWIEGDPVRTPEQEEAHKRWSQHKFGLCPGCRVGLDDKSEFTINYSFSAEHGIMLCHVCDEKNKRQFQKFCTNCFNAVNDGDTIIGSIHPVSSQLVVTFCRKC